jgi:C-3',4' desaturase CrtD
MAMNVVVVGAGVGGLTTAAVLARAGFDVTVLEAHIYPGGCAGTFYHQQYRFDAGATLAGGFYPGGPMDIVARSTGIADWLGHPADPVMAVHLPDGTSITRWSDPARRHAERREKFSARDQNFWQWQEATADALWDLALRLPPWPPQSPGQAVELVGQGLGWLAEAPLKRLQPRFALDALRPVAAHLRGASERLRLFVDGQLLIAAQAPSLRANALYGASALDLPRRGVRHLAGGMGGIAETLAQAVRDNGGQVIYRREVQRVVLENGRPKAAEAKRGHRYPADVVIFNLPPWNIATLLAEQDFTPPRLKKLPPQPQPGWGAFMVYVGFDASLCPADWPLHHQLIVREPLAEGNTIFLSLSPAWDADRAPAGQRALTISTHTNLRAWWTLFEQDRPAYETRKQAYTQRILRHAERVLPGLREAAHLIKPGTPVTFQRFTRRAKGWVGGFPQTDLFRAWPPHLSPGLWLVGDSIFPGQSTAAVALGGLRVAEGVRRAGRA